LLWRGILSFRLLLFPAHTAYLRLCQSGTFLLFKTRPRKNMSGIVTLVSQDNQKIEVELNVIRQSKVISGMLQDLGEDKDEYPIPNVSHAILKKIIEWCEQHKDDAPVEIEDEDPSYQEWKTTAEVPRWDAEFLKVDQGTLFDIILAAHSLDIRRLEDFACMTVSRVIRFAPVFLERNSQNTSKMTSPRRKWSRSRRKTSANTTKFISTKKKLAELAFSAIPRCLQLFEKSSI